MIRNLKSRRLVIAYNPHSSRAAEVQVQVFDRLNAAGYPYVTIEVKQAPLAENVHQLAPLIKENDIVLSAAGDGSAHAIFHTVLAAKQPGVELGFLAYGNFNDIPHAFNDNKSLRDPVTLLETAESEQVWPLEVLVDDKPLRGAVLYATIGWTARAASRFDDPKLRSSIKNARARLIQSIWRVGLYYLKSRGDSLLPPFSHGGLSHAKTTDLIFANGPTVARLFRSGKRYYRQKVFLYRKLDVRKLVTNVPFLLSGLIGKMKGEEVTEVIINFDAQAQVPIQCDGEVVIVESCSKIQVIKATKSLTILTTK